MGLLLKVLSGTHQGAEFDIPDEEVMIGASDECDVIISDVLVANKHMKLGLVDEHVFVTPLEGNVFIAGKLLRTPSAVDNFQFLTIGATHMMFGDIKSEEWKTLALDDFPELEKVEEEVSTFGESTDKKNETIFDGDENQKSSQIKKISMDTKVGNVEGTELTDREVKKTDDLKKPSGPRLTFRQKIIRYFTGFLVCFMIATAISTTVVILREEKSTPAPPQPIEKRVQKAIDELKLNVKIKVSKVGDEPVSVVGYVDKMADSMAIKSSLKAISEDISIKLLVMEKIINNAMEIVKESKRNVVLRNSEEFGEVIAMGYIRKEEIWTNLKSEIASIKGIINVKDEVLTKTSAVELAKNILDQYKFQDKLEATATEEGIEVKGTISDIDKDTWTKAREDFEKSFKKKAQLNFAIAVSTDRNLTFEKFFGGKIDSVNFNSQGLDWINIKNGNKYFQGSILPSGYVIDQIEAKSVIIRNADKIIKLDFELI